MEQENQNRRPYVVGVDRNGCERRRAGSVWTVIGPDGAVIGESVADEEHADAICEMLNMAFDAGVESVRKSEPELRPLTKPEKGRLTVPETKLLTREQAVKCVMEDMPPEVETQIALDACRTLEAMAADLRMLRQQLSYQHPPSRKTLGIIYDRWDGTGWLEER